MKQIRTTLSLFAALALIGCSSSDKSNGPDSTNTAELDTAIVDYKGDAPQTVFYDLSTDSMTSVPLYSWDLAIATTTGEIRTNGGNFGSGVLVYQTKETDIDADLSDLKDSVKYIQTNKNNLFANEISRQATGSDTVYIIQDAEGKYFKIKFESFGIDAKYTIKLAAGLDAKAQELKGTMTMAQGYVRLDLSAAKDVSNLFPQSWDLCFTRGLEQKQYAGPGVDSMVIAQSVIYVNADANVAVSLDTIHDFADVNAIQGVDFLQAYDAIGAKWYDANYDPVTHVSNPTVRDEFYLIQVSDNEFHKVQFKSFFGPNQESFFTVLKHEEVNH